MTECGFCHGKPVGNARTWVDGKPRPPAACPRCGEVNWPEDVEAALDALSRAALAPAPPKDGAA
jgi:hypothetical protein